MGYFDDVWEQETELTAKLDIAHPLERRRRRCREDANRTVWTRVEYEKRLFGKVIGVFIDALNKRSQ